MREGHGEGEFCGGTRLYIRDHINDNGDVPLPAALQHWYSPDIVIIQPNGTRGGEAIAGQLNQVEIRVTNDCGIPANDALVDAFFCTPSTGFTPATTIPIGADYLTIDGYSSAVIRIPWVPDPDHAGHACILARVSLLFPPDTYADGTIFDVRGDRHIAQRNISIVALMQAQQFIFPFTIVNTALEPAVLFVVAQELRGREDLNQLRASAGFRFAQFGKEPLPNFGMELTKELVTMGEQRPGGKFGYGRMQHQIELSLDAGAEQPAVLVVERSPYAEEGTLHAIEVRQYDRYEQLVGGLTVLVEH